MRPLEGLFVLDFTTLLPGPMATLLLAEAGAEVIKIERPEGEDMRAYPSSWGRDSIYFALLNRGKKSLALDLKDMADRAALEPLLARADVIVEQFRPDVMEGSASVPAMSPRSIRKRSIARSPAMARRVPRATGPVTISITSAMRAYSPCRWAPPMRPSCRRRSSPTLRRAPIPL